MGRFSKDISGQRFGRWLVLRRNGCTAGGHALYDCVCDCGVHRTVAGFRMRRGDSKSCGCLAADLSAARVLEHGMTKHRLFGTWSSMMHRCYSPNSKVFGRYGGRGISVCERWHDVRLFIADNDAKALPGLTIDRRDNDGPYSPENTRWIERREQNLNYSRNVHLEFEGKRQTLREWADERGIGLGTLWHRVRVLSWPAERALTQPVRRR